MTTKHDPYASEEETQALLVPDTRTEAERKLAAMMAARGADEQGAEAYPILRQIALELIAQHLQDDPDHIDPATHIDILKSWLLEANVSSDALSKHLVNVIEIAETWQPEYATKMDLDTIRNAKERLPVQKHAPISWPCKVIQADFDDNIITLQMPNGDFWVSAGVYQLSPPAQTTNKG